jgi:hypothetical protein
VTEIADGAGQRPAGGLRVELLRFVALAILIGNLVLGADHGASIQTAVVVAYLAVSAASALTVLSGIARNWVRIGFVMIGGEFTLAAATSRYRMRLAGPAGCP